MEGRFSYFCRAECKLAYLRNLGGFASDDVPTARPPEVSPAAKQLIEPSFPETPVRQMLPSERAASTQRPGPQRASRKIRGDALAALDPVGIALGSLVPAIALLGPAVEVARLPLVFMSLTALVVRIVVAGRDPADPHPFVVLAPAVGAVVAACWASATDDGHAAGLAYFAGLSCAAAIAVELLVRRARRRVVATRELIESALDVRVRAVRGEERISVPAYEVRPGEAIIVESGEIVGVDGIVDAGEARVLPWLNARVEIVRREGDPIFAGARVLSNVLRMTTTRSGGDRAWVKLLAHPAMRIDVASPSARAMRLTVERGAPLAAVVVGFGAVVANAQPVEVLAAMCAGAIAFGAKAACSLSALHFSRAHLRALQTGIIYKDARAFERAAAATIVVLSARGTVLLGEPEIVAIEPLISSESERVLSLAAGAEIGSAHPFASAVLRAARMRDVRPDDVRNATVHAGLGVVAVASSGERVVVGGRTLMLQEKIGVAVTDQRVSELEAEGRSVLLVALGDRVIGIIALQDGLRAGARAAVQKLLDARIEPVLLSGEARDTCETIGRALDIEHVRPEVLPQERGLAVRALAEGGNVVAVIGHALGDDGALGAADVAVAMGSAGSTSGEWAVVLVSDDVRDAALALAIPHAARDRARLAIALGAAPGLVALLAIGFGVASPVVAPIATLIGAVAVAAFSREPAP